ncbi:MAG: cytochrome P450, partial [Acidimicrobiaceae bacterium]|nr:cytochrome P450 [Acidimicrobiaceae bacterium]
MTYQPLSGQLDRERIRNLFDLRRRGGGSYGGYINDPYPTLHRLRETGPVHPGTVHELLGYDGPAIFQGLPNPDRPHFSVFDFSTCDRVFRDDVTFRSALGGVEAEAAGINSSMLNMDGQEHRRYRTLVQPSFVPPKARWWIENWIDKTVNDLIDGFARDGRAELNVDFDAAIPVLTITGSFGFEVSDALDIREALEGRYGEAAVSVLERYLAPIIAERRRAPRDDLISVLCEATLPTDDGTQRLSDEEILSFSHLLLAAGSGTTWKQLGITLTALLTHPEALEAVRQDRALLKAAIEESVRWCPTDPMFSRYACEDTELAGVRIPAGAVVHLSLGAAGRDPARWAEPDA